MSYTPTPATARAIILDDAGRMLLVQRSSSDPFQPGKWDIPGGGVEPNETIESAVRREVEEEVGLVLSDVLLLFATSDMRGNESKTWLFFIAPLPADTSITLGDEHDEYKWIKPSELVSYTDYEILLRLHDYVIKNGLLT